MIADLDRSIAALLRRELPTDLLAQVEISFATPDDQFPPTGVKLPAIDVFLYDIRENTDLRQADPIVERSLDGTHLRQPPVRVDCSYLVTAWPAESSDDAAQDEHRLLGAVMVALLRHRSLPAAVLEGALVGSEPLPAGALQPSRLQSVAEFWQARGSKPKPTLTYTVTLSIEPAEAVPAGPPVTATEIRFTGR